MKKLRTLNVRIPHPSVLPEDMNFYQLTKYIIEIGNVSSWFRGTNRGSRNLVLNLESTNDILQKEYMQSILSKTDDLHLRDSNGIEQSIWRLSQERFPQLKHIHVNGNPSVRYILEQSFLPAFKALETLILEDLANLERICHSQISTDSFSTLKVVRVDGCNKMEVMFPRSVVRELSQLEEIRVVDCELLRGIVEADDDPSKFELPKLRVLELRNLPNIDNFISVGSARSSSTSDDDEVIAFFNGQQVTFPSLETLEVKGLDNLWFMFSPSMVESLGQLRKLNVRNCDYMEAIIMEEEGLGVEISETLSFPILIDLQLECLESLTCFFGEQCSQEGRSQDSIQSRSSVFFNKEIDFPKLETLEVRDLGNLEFIFYPSMVKSLARLRKLSVWGCEKMDAIITEEEGWGMEASETLTFSTLIDLDLYRLESLTCFSREKCSREGRSKDGVESHSNTFFNREVAFPSLKKLVVCGLNNFGFMFSPSTVKSLAQLRELTVSSCKKMEGIIMEEEGLGVEISFPMLTDLRLHVLESLTCFSRGKCSREGRSQDNVQVNSSVLFNRKDDFPRLETLEISGLHHFGFVFYPSMVKSLAQLRKLAIRRCKKMEVIIAKEEGIGMETSETLTFPMLTDLRLEDLNSLAWCFSRGNCSRENQIRDGIQLHSSALFNREVSFPFLKSLTIEILPNLKKIWSDESPLEPRNLRSLVVKSCKSLSKVISSKSLVILRKLQTLYIHDCDLVQEIFDLEGANTSGYVETWSDLTTLKLRLLPNLRCIWNKNPCGIASFHKLKELDVYSCESLGFLLFPSMVKSLAQLRDLTVKECYKMEAIVTEQEGLGLEISETLTFLMLTNLSLYRLESLSSFYRGKRSREARSEDHVNSHSAALFSQEVSFPLLESLTLEELPKIKDIWSDDESPLEPSNLRYLKVLRCESLSKAISSRSLVKLYKLQTLCINDCSSVQENFDLDEEGLEDMLRLGLI